MGTDPANPSQRPPPWTSPEVISPASRGFLTRMSRVARTRGRDRMFVVWSFLLGLVASGRRPPLPVALPRPITRTVTCVIMLLRYEKKSGSTFAVAAHAHILEAIWCSSSPRASASMEKEVLPGGGTPPDPCAAPALWQRQQLSEGTALAEKRRVRSPSAL